MLQRMLCSVALWWSSAIAAMAGQQLVLHEWGTFTSFQNEAGYGLLRINTDDEPVPEFVHQLLKAPPATRQFSPTEFPVDFPSRDKGFPSADLRVRMRLETPVLYFHLPAGQKSMTLDVAVDFQQGFLTQYFPAAEATVNGQPVEKTKYPKGKPMYSTLKWSGVQVGKSGPLPETTDRVWLAPRQVDAAPVTIGDESERFLFYRGVGTLEAPLRVVRHSDQMLDVRLNSAALVQLGRSAGDADLQPWIRMMSLQWSWLVEVLPDGRTAFRHLQPAGAGDPLQLGLASGAFSADEFSTDRLTELRREMRTALMEDGLNPDEADALLNTWELSYFLSPGQRLFFLVPRQWTDAVLPLRLSVPAEIQRVMVGRIELVTPRQRNLIQQIAASPVPDLTDVIRKMTALKHDPVRRDIYNALASGRGDSSSLGVPVPSIYEAFLALGRFRTSLLLDTLSRNPRTTPGPYDRVMQLQFELLYPGVMQRD